MKMTALLILIFSLHVHARSFSQKITLAVKKVPIQQVFREIKKQTGYSFLYTSDVLEVAGNVTLNAKDAPLEMVLQSCFEGTSLTYSIIDKTVVVKFKEQQPHDKILQAEKQGTIIRGKVSDENNRPLEGVSVLFKNTNKGVYTDSSGIFSIAVPDNVQPILLFSYVGMEDKEVNAQGKSSLQVILASAVNQQQEIVVTGYGTQKKKDVTGSVASLKGSELVSAPNTSTSQALQGRVAGAMVQNASGNPAGDVVIRIRGANSLTYGNDPLIIIDGVQGGNMGSLNPADVESVEVLKDAAALSVYGSRGANGVILVTTKNGKRGKPHVSYNGFVSMDEVRRMLPVMGAKQYAGLVNEARNENGLDNLFSADDIAGMGEGTNWQKEIFRTGLTQNHNLSVSGANDNISYFISGGYVDKQGIVLNTSFRQYRLRSNLKVQATKSLSFGLNAFYTYDVANNGDYGGAIASALQWSPTKSVYDDKGNYTQPGGGVGPVSLYNPVGYAKESVNDNFNTALNVAPNVELKVAKSLKVASQLAYILNSTFAGYFDNQVVNLGPPENIGGGVTQGRYISLQNTNQLTYDIKLGEHTVQFTGVYEIFKDQYRATGNSANGVPLGLGYNGLSFGTHFFPPTVSISNTARRSFMGRMNYNYKGKYLLSISDRYDGASQLADGNKNENFYAVAGGWNIMEEPFAKNLLTVFPQLKLRASYGQVGNAAVPAYSSQMLFYPGVDAANNPTLTIKQLANPDLRWERTSELNIGVDGKLFNQFISFSAEYYSKKTTDLLMWQNVPAAVGVQSVLTNVGSVANKGFDFSIEATPFSKKNFKWISNLTFNYNQNRILALDGNSDTIYYSAADYPGIVGSFVQMKGQPMGTFLGYKFAGVWNEADAAKAAGYNAKPGDARYVDVNNDGKIDKNDISIIGNAQPKFVFGWNNTITWNQFTINIFWQGVSGNQVYNQNRIRREAYTSDAFPTSPIIADHYTPQNQHTNVPSFTGFEYLNSSRWVENGAYLRMKNISLAYQVPARLFGSSNFISSARIYASGGNLITISKYTGFDPEASIGRDASAAGVDRSVYPSQKSLTIGVDIAF